jgi:hypothetical protein
MISGRSLNLPVKRIHNPHGVLDVRGGVRGVEIQQVHAAHLQPLQAQLQLQYVANCRYTTRGIIKDRIKKYMEEKKCRKYCHVINCNILNVSKD